MKDIKQKELSTLTPKRNYTAIIIFVVTILLFIGLGCYLQLGEKPVTESEYFEGFKQSQIGKHQPMPLSEYDSIQNFCHNQSMNKIFYPSPSFAYNLENNMKLEDSLFRYFHLYHKIHTLDNPQYTSSDLIFLYNDSLQFNSIGGDIDKFVMVVDAKMLFPKWLKKLKSYGITEKDLQHESRRYRHGTQFSRTLRLKKPCRYLRNKTGAFTKSSLTTYVEMEKRDMNNQAGNIIQQEYKNLKKVLDSNKSGKTIIYKFRFQIITAKDGTKQRIKVLEQDNIKMVTELADKLMEIPFNSTGNFELTLLYQR